MGLTINIKNFREVSNIEINIYAEILVSKAVARINITSRLVDGQLTDLVVIDDGFVFVYGNDGDEIFQMVEAYEGVSLLRAEVHFNELFTRYELVVKQLARTKECTDEHIITGELKHQGDFLYYMQNSKFRDKDV